jgi:DNA-binding ferritin-like protein
LFDDIADRLRHFVDVMAERATALGGVAQSWTLHARRNRGPGERRPRRSRAPHLGSIRRVGCIRRRRR